MKKAIAAGKHVYCEKPTAVSTEAALDLYRVATKAGVKNGVVQDKLWLPGLLKVKRLQEQGFFGKILSVRGEFGYWVFEGHNIPAQRPSWNYRKEDDGGIIVDMLCHWRYVIDNLFGEVKSLTCLGATHIPERVDEQGKTYKCTADDSAYATFELANGVVAHFNSSWNVRVRRDDLLTLQIDGTHGSAVAGLREVWIQHYGNTPKPVWNPDIAQPIDFYGGWSKVPEQENYDNAFKCSGSFSSATSCSTSRSAGRCSKAQRECRWPSSVWKAGPSAPGWTCLSFQPRHRPTGFIVLWSGPRQPTGCAASRSCFLSFRSSFGIPPRGEPLRRTPGIRFSGPCRSFSGILTKSAFIAL